MKLFLSLTNNILFNNLLILLGLDKMVLSRLGMYRRVRLDEKLSPQEMAGFSTRHEVQEAIDKTHHDLLQVVQTYVPPGAAILDIGCGPGTYLKDFEGRYRLTGIDLNQQMIAAAERHLSGAELIHDDFMARDFSQTFQLIYSVSVLEFIPPSQLRAFFRKVHHLLEPDGLLFLHYPHALTYADTLYPDLYYIEYSPRKVEKELKHLFKIIKHAHGYDGRKIDLYDSQPYRTGERTFKNGYLLVAMKKGSPNL